MVEKIKALNGTWKNVIMSGQAVVIIFLLGFLASIVLQDRAAVSRNIEEMSKAVALQAKVTEKVSEIVCWTATTPYEARAKQLKDNPRLWEALKELHGKH